MNLTANVHREWSQVYREVPVTVVHWGKPSDGCTTGVNDGYGIWCYYLTLPERLFQPGDFSKFWLRSSGKGVFDYCRTPIQDLDWHGGITFYERIVQDVTKVRAVKLGCDFAHYNDQGWAPHYNEFYVWERACRSVDALHALFPNLKRRCSWSGTYYDANQGEINEKGVWNSHASLEKRTLT